MHRLPALVTPLHCTVSELDREDVDEDELERLLFGRCSAEVLVFAEADKPVLGGDRAEVELGRGGTLPVAGGNASNPG